MSAFRRDVEESVFFENVILGGGLAGLGAQSVLTDAVVIDRESSLGGHARSFSFMGYDFDYGAHICHSKNENWLEAINTTNLNSIVASDVRNFDDGEWIGYPVQNNLRELPPQLRQVVYEEIKDRLKAQEPVAANSYREWCDRHYGPTLTEKYYRRFTHKYWRTPMSEMGTHWLNGRILPIDIGLVERGLHESEPHGQAVFSSFKYPQKGGFANLFEPLVESVSEVMLTADVVSVNPSARVVELADGRTVGYRNILSTLPLPVITQTLTSIPDAILHDVSSLKYLNLIVAAVVIPDFEDELPDWFYVYDSDVDISRVMNISKVSGRRDGNLVLQLETFRRNDEAYDYDDVCSSMKAGLEKILKATLSASNFTFRFVEYSYVVPTIESVGASERIHSFLEDQGIVSCGLYGRWNYVWSDAAYFDGVETAKILRASH